MKIIQTTKDLLSSEAVWDKNSTRKCVENAEKLDLFCALQQATVTTTGAFQYRQPAMQIVRALINERVGDKIKKHRLMEYNNSPETSLQDVHGLLDDAYQRLEGLMKGGEL